MKLYTPQYKPNNQEMAIFTTSKGVIKVKLFGKNAPIAVGNFVELATKGFYDGVKVHRYLPKYIVQAGCPHTRNATVQQIRDAKDNKMFSSRKIGKGDAGYRIKDEFKVNPKNHHLDGSLCMAKTDKDDSGSSQFYFCLGNQRGLDRRFTVFGRTLEGLDVVHALQLGDTVETIRIEGTDQVQLEAIR